MTAISQDFTLYAGDAAAPIFTVQDQNGYPININGVADIVWTVIQTLTSPSVILKRKALGQITFVTDGMDGRFTVTITNADTSQLAGYYLHDAQIIDSFGNVTTVTLGRLQIGRVPSWTYSGNPANSAKDQVRFYLGDTDSANPEMMDEEILWAISLRGNNWGATALCAMALATKYSRLTSISADGVSQGLNQKAPAFRLIAAEYQRKEAIYRAVPTLGGVSIGDMRRVLSNLDRVPDIFRIAINDNPPSDGTNPVNEPPLGSGGPFDPNFP